MVKIKVLISNQAIFEGHKTFWKAKLMSYLFSLLRFFFFLNLDHKLFYISRNVEKFYFYMHQNTNLTAAPNCLKLKKKLFFVCFLLIFLVSYIFKFSFTWYKINIQENLYNFTFYINKFLTQW